MPEFLRIGVLAILSMTIVGKLTILTGEHDLLIARDPLFAFASTRQMLFLASLCEIVAFSILVCAKAIYVRELAVAWIGTVFLAYRVGLLAMGYRGPCACMGNLGAKFGLSAREMDYISLALLACLLAVGYFYLIKGLVLTERANRTALAK